MTGSTVTINGRVDQESGFSFATVTAQRGPVSETESVRGVDPGETLALATRFALKKLEKS